ncbi:MAG TPA: chaplin family protein [Actinokineospora sp.]|nr:chaplin family protein [Actinokineospora sp.]
MHVLGKITLAAAALTFLVTPAASATDIVLGGEGDDRPHGTQFTTGEGSILGGNQVFAPITAPINVCGVAAGVLGAVDARCEGGVTAPSSARPGPVAVSPDERSDDVPLVLPIAAPIEDVGADAAHNATQNVPVNVCGLGLPVLGASIPVASPTECTAASTSGSANGDHNGGRG